MTEMKKLHSPAEIPAFASEGEEAEFWSTHQLAEDYPMNLTVDPDLEAALPPRRSRESTRAISIKMEMDLLERIRDLAERKHIPYQTLIKQFLGERVYEEEKRLKII